jgi:multicomponent Na+:H+ antiporter subunit E
MAMTTENQPLLGQTITQQRRKLVILTLLLAGVWWVMTQGSAASWLIGLPAVAAATWASRRFGRSSKLSVSALGMLRFMPFFLWESLRGGVDVALRTLAPRMRIQTGFIRYRTHLDNPASLTFFANCVSLLPGTLAADLQDDWLEVHVLNTRSDHLTELSRLESAVARVFVANGGSR